MPRVIAYSVFYAHFAFMGVIFFGKAFTPPGFIDVLIILTVLTQIIFKICPVTTLEESLFKKANLEYTYKSWTKWIHAHFGGIGHLLSMFVMWSVSEITLMVYSSITNTPYTNFVLESITAIF